MKALFAVLTVIVLASACVADDYVFRNGYYYYGHGTDAYTRTLVQAPGYYYCGRYYPGASYYQYQLAPYKAPLTSADPHWRIKMLDIADKKLEQAYFIEAAKVLGLEGAISQGTQTYYGQGQSQSYTSTGNTAYGYQTKYLDLYGSTPSQEFQQYARLSETLINGATGIAAQFGQDAAKLSEIEGANRAKIAQILAERDYMLALNAAVKGGTTKLETKTYQFKTGTPQPQAQPKDLRGLFEQSATNRCLSCHSGNKKEGGFDVTQFPAMNAQQQMKVIERMTTSDEARRMPRTPAGAAGPRVPTEEVQAWYSQIDQSAAMPPAK